MVLGGGAVSHERGSPVWCRVYDIRCMGSRAAAPAPRPSQPAVMVRGSGFRVPQQLRVAVENFGFVVQYEVCSVQFVCRV